MTPPREGGDQVLRRKIGRWLVTKDADQTPRYRDGGAWYLMASGQRIRIRPHGRWSFDDFEVP